MVHRVVIAGIAKLVVFYWVNQGMPRELGPESKKLGFWGEIDSGNLDIVCMTALKLSSKHAVIRKL